ncbi:MAG: thiamine pyrophosphate-dependent enzyme, partial [Planctomycetota bacterium]
MDSHPTADSSANADTSDANAGQPDPSSGGRVVFDAANAGNLDYLAQQYEQYLTDPQSVDETWQAFFAGFALGDSGSDTTEPQTPSTNGSAIRRRPSHDGVPATLAGHVAGRHAHAAPQTDSAVGVYDLVHTYREFGHFESTLDPLAGDLDKQRNPHPMLALDNFGLGDCELDATIGKGGFLGETDGTLRDLLDKLRKTYCRNVGVEFTAIADQRQRQWLQEHMEPSLNRPSLSSEQRVHLLKQLMAAEEFEQYLHRAFVGAKRFSVEGGESIVPLLNTIVEQSCAHGGEQVICSMAHRGRLNVLAHVLEKPYETMLAEFAGTIPHKGELQGDGDVKYHLGYANSRRVKADADSDYSNVKVSLLPNPSHLELINPIQQGIVRCKQQWLLDGNREKVVPVCLHGDAAFCGQGIVFETLNLSELRGYRTGGTIHIIVNNQIGFTTPPKQGRFTPYPTDVAKSIQAPVFHVNGDDPEAVVHAAKVATEFRQKFHKDVVIDIFCYRRFGHNEGDEPMF